MSITVDCNHTSPSLALVRQLQGATGCDINHLVLFLSREAKNGFGACVRVVGRGEWSVRALRRIDPQTRLRDLDVSGYIAADETP